MTGKRCLHACILCGLSLLVLALPMLTQAQGQGPRGYLAAPVGINALSTTYMDLWSNMEFSGNISIPDIKFH